MRWTDRLIGIVSTLILARLLVPADFGIVVMAALVVTLTETLLDLSVGSALVQNRDADRSHFDTAWTLGLAQAAVAAGLIAIVGAPLAADYFNDPRVVDVLRVMALSVLIGGMQNIGIVAFQKNMEFGRDFRFLFLRRVAGFVVTIALALWLQSYWAMVFGALAGRVAGVILSYGMHDFRPRLSLTRISEIWSFSQWILVRNLGAYGATQTDKLLVGRREGASTLGGYALADEISVMPTGELLAPLGRVLFPAFVRVADQPEELRRIFCLAFGVQVLVALPAGVGLALVAPTAVPLLLGPQWAFAIPLVQTLSLANIFVALAHGGGYLLLTLGKVRLMALITWVQFALLLLLALVVLPTSNAEGIAGMRLVVSLTGMALLLAIVLRTAPLIRVGDLIGGAWRPASGALVMTMVLRLTEFSPTLWAGWALLAEIAVGGATYGFTVLALWRLSGCGDGAENYLLEKTGLKQRVLTILGVGSR